MASFDVKYTVGERVKTDGKIYVVIGYEFIPQRAVRYILMHVKDGAAVWEFMYDFEIDAMTV